MADIFPPNLTSALDRLEQCFQDPYSAPRTDIDLVERLGEYLQDGNPQAPSRLYVPDPDSPITPETKNEQISRPLIPLDTEVRNLSARAKHITLALVALTSESQQLVTGLTSTLTSAATQANSLQTLLSNSNLSWMSYVDRFLTLDGVDPAASNNVDPGTSSGSGIGLTPTSDQDLTGAIQTLTVVQNLSQKGLPGDNTELAAIQATPGTQAPSAGSGTALVAAQQVASSGGSGLEPVVSYAGNPDPRNNPNSMLTDTPESWFEWEAVFVPSSQPCIQQGTAYVASESGNPTDPWAVTQGYGWDCQLQNPDGSQSNHALVYFGNPPVAGASAGATLVLSLEIDMGQGVPITEIDLTVRQVGGLWPTIQGIQVSLDHSQWFTLTTQGGAQSWQGDAAATAAVTSAINSGGGSVPANGSSILGTSTWQIPSYSALDPSGNLPTFRYISITFQQPEAYACPKGIGHPYYVEVVKNSSSSTALFGLVHSQSQSTNTTRYATPQPLINVKVGSGTSSTSQPGKGLGQVLGAVANALPVAALGNTLSSLGNIAGGVGSLVSGFVTGLIGSSTHSTQVLQSGEYTDIFEAYRQCISVGRIKPLARVYPTGQGGQMVTREISFNHPFTAVRLLVDQRVPAGTSITYDISDDGGQTWQSIQALDLGQPPAPSLTPYPTYTLNLQSPQQSCRLRATLSTTQAHVTPRLMAINLQALPST